MESVNKRIIGRKDLVSFPGFGLDYVPVKIDSGAYSSSMHCQSIEVVELDNREQLRVVFLDPSFPGYTGKEVVFSDFKTKLVKSSNGIAQERFFVKGTVQLFGESVETVFSLTERNGLRNPVLLGRKLLNKRFLIDPSKTNCSYTYENNNL